MAYIELVDRPDELRPARTTDFVYAVEKGFVPLPDGQPLPDDPAKLEELAKMAPSTSQNARTLQSAQPSFLRYNRDGKIALEKRNEKYMAVPLKYSKLDNPFIFAKSDSKIAAYLERLEAARAGSSQDTGAAAAAAASTTTAPNQQ